MFERFTDRARRIVVLAQEEARELQHNYIGTEHILLGLIREGEGIAAQALAALSVGLDSVREQVESIIGMGEESQSGHIPFTPRAKKVLELSLREALQLGHDYIGTEHILLGLVREGDGVAAKVLVRLGADLKRVRQQVIEILQEKGGEETPGRRTAVAGPLGLSRAHVGEVLERLGDVAEQMGTAMHRLTSIERRLARLERHTGASDVALPDDGDGGAPGDTAPPQDEASA